MTTAEYSEEYKEFVKNALVNQCISEYKRVVFEMNSVDDGTEEYTKTLQNVLHDSFVWEIVFKKLEPIFNFYTELENNLIGINDADHVFYKEDLTFQQYIDEKYNMKTLGPYDFETFCKNMQYEGFSNKMKIQYRINQKKNLVKDHIVFIVGLHICPPNQNNFRFQYDFEACQQMQPQMVNAVPYFERLQEKGWTIDQIEEGSLFEQSGNAGERSELKALKLIQQTLFV
jgi:hypothetical protein